MRKRITRTLILLLTAAITLSSCAVYTIGMGKERIAVPEKVTEPETRLRVINERKDEIARKERERLERIEAEKEARRKAEEERRRIEAEEKAAAEALYLATAVYEYPENLSDLTLPWNYRPRKDHLELNTELEPISVLFLPLDPESDAERIKTSIMDLDADFIMLTGSTEQLVETTEILGRDTVLFEDAAVLYNTRVSSYDASSCTFDIGGGKKIEVAVVNDHPELPENSRSIKAWLDDIESENASLDAVALEEENVIFALSSSMPAGDDWQTFSPYPYRSEMSFTTPSWFTSRGFRDAWSETHFSSETDPGITRESGDVFERMDFIYTKDMAALESVTFSVAGMKNRAIYAEFLLP